MAGDGPRQPACDIFSIERTFLKILSFDLLISISCQSVAVPMTYRQMSLSLVFLQAVWTPKFWGWTSSSTVLSQVVGRPAGLLQSAGERWAHLCLVALLSHNRVINSFTALRFFCVSSHSVLYDSVACTYTFRSCYAINYPYSLTQLGRRSVPPTAAIF